MSILLDIGHFSVSFAFLIYIYFRIRYLRRATLLHFTSSVVVICACLFFPLVQYEMWSVEGEGPSGRALVVSALFVGCCVGVDLLFYQRRLENRAVTYVPTTITYLVLAFIFLFGFVGFLRYFFVARGVDYLGTVFSAVTAGEDYYASRIAVAETLGSTLGVGVAHSQMVLSGVFPVVIGFCLSMAMPGMGLLRNGLVVASVLQSFLIASVTFQRSSMIFVVAFPMVLWFFMRTPYEAERRLLRAASGRGILVSFLVVVGLGCGAYSWTNAENVVGQVGTAFKRVFVVPSMVGAWYYQAFPDVFPFRSFTLSPGVESVECLFFMSAEYGGATASTREVAENATRDYRMNANANFLATAYSAAGLAGSLIVIVVFLAVIVVIDKCFEQASAEFRALNILVNLSGIVTLTNVPLGVAMSTAGYAYPSLLLWLLWRTCKPEVRNTPSGSGRAAVLPDAV